MTLRLRTARPLDAGSVGGILGDFAIHTPWMPRIHTGAEDIQFAGYMIDQGWVTVACYDQAVIGFITIRDGMVLSLYLAQGACRQGIGKALLNDAKTNARSLNLWCFQANKDAQRFYIREGFAEIARGDGSENEEGLPDIQFRWDAPSQEGAVA